MRLDLARSLRRLRPERFAGTRAATIQHWILSGGHPVFRPGGFSVGQEVAALNDATIDLHALERGYTVLTRNIRDFDAMNQIVPTGRVLFYRQV